MASCPESTFSQMLLFLLCPVQTILTVLGMESSGGAAQNPVPLSECSLLSVLHACLLVFNLTMLLNISGWPFTLWKCPWEDPHRLCWVSFYAPSQLDEWCLLSLLFWSCCIVLMLRFLCPIHIWLSGDMDRKNKPAITLKNTVCSVLKPAELTI